MARERLRGKATWLLAAVLAGAPAALPAQSRPTRPEVSIIGASMSAGFVDPFTSARGGERNRSFRLRRALQALWPREQVRIRDYSDVVTFLAPRKRGGIQVRRANRQPSDLVLGIDFMFWFGYGGMGGGGEEARLALQRKGFALLEKITAPLILGDYPDMTGADPRMLGPHMIPSPKTLAELNARLGAWAKRHPNVHLFPLAALVSELKGGRLTIHFHGTERRLPSKALLQSDRLHPTRLGVALLVQRLQKVIASALPAHHPLRVARRTEEQLILRLDLADDLLEGTILVPAAGKVEPGRRHPPETVVPHRDGLTPLCQGSCRLEDGDAHEAGSCGASTRRPAIVGPIYPAPVPRPEAATAHAAPAPSGGGRAR